MGSDDYATSNPNPSNEDGSSLAARRARLRGTLAKQAAPPDPYKPDPYLIAPTESGSSPSSTLSQEPAHNDVQSSAPQTPFIEPSPAPNPDLSQALIAGATQAPSVGAIQAPSADAIQAPSAYAIQAPSADPIQAPTSEMSQAPSLDPSGAQIPAFETPAPDWSAVADETEALAAEIANEIAAAAVEEQPVQSTDVAAPYGGSSGGNGSGSSANTFSSSSFFASIAPEQTNRTEEQASFFSDPEVESVAEPESETIPQPTIARVDRRRHTGAPVTMPNNLPDTSAPSDPGSLPSSDSSVPAAVENADFDYAISTTSTVDPAPPVESTPSITPMPPNVVPSADVSMSSASADYVYGIQTSPSQQQAPTQLQTQALEIMNNIDQAMGACAMNLSELQKIATEQTDALKGVAETLQNQSFFEIGLNLNSLMESLSAALEPMKAVGELVPAIDQLVAVMESRESGGGSSSEEPSRLSREQLITSLAEQLSSGMIDPWTFKCAYMAVFPAEHPADLLHRLVDLLGTQRLSGDLFRAAYDAVQAADPPQRVSRQTSENGEQRTMVQDETIIAQLDELKRTNEEFAKRNEEIQRKLESKDQEYNKVLTAKEQELQEAQELLNSRWEEFNTRYDELTETLHKRDEVLQERESELAKKESENSMLRAQMEELSNQTKDMVADLQKQLSAKPKEEAPKQPGFFDVAPGAQQNLQQGQAQPQQLFDAGPARPLFGQTEQQQQATSNPMEQLQPQAAQAQLQQPQPQQQALQQPMTPQPVQPQGNQAVPRPAAPTTPFVSGAGSYGSGVRAQVFEVIVRQALAGAPWREICAGPMQVNNISPEEVETEVKRRQALLKK
jgi:hypothetical protein